MDGGQMIEMNEFGNLARASRKNTEDEEEENINADRAVSLKSCVLGFIWLFRDVPDPTTSKAIRLNIRLLVETVQPMSYFPKRLQKRFYQQTVLSWYQRVTKRQG